MAASEYFVTDTRDQGVNLIRQAAASVVRGGSCALYDRIGSDHFAGDQVSADAEMLQRALGLCPPKLVVRHINPAHPIGFRSKI
jgi:hypothetical protein